MFDSFAWVCIPINTNRCSRQSLCGSGKWENETFVSMGDTITKSVFLSRRMRCMKKNGAHAERSECAPMHIKKLRVEKIKIL